MENQEQKEMISRTVPIPPDVWERLAPVYEKKTEHKDRMAELMRQMDDIKAEMKMLAGNVGFAKRKFFIALRNEMPELSKMEENSKMSISFEIELDPPRVKIEPIDDDQISKIKAMAGAFGVDLSALGGF